MKYKIPFHFTPPQTITASFAAMILTGAFLLNLPFASQDGRSIGFLNALFTATSANCVTGLVVVNTAAHWTVFGKVVILLLIQMGGLGFISIITANLLILRRKVSLRNRIVIQSAFNQESVGGMVRLVKMVLYITMAVELTGALLLAIGFYAAGGMTVWQALVNGFFHSISAFCNAGFDILGPSSLIPYQQNWFINLIFMALIIIGGLGFTVWSEVIESIKSPKNHRKKIRTRWIHLSLHSKMAILVTSILISTGLLMFLLLEWNNPETLGPLPWSSKILVSLFQSVTLRTCGFDSMNQVGLTELSKMISSVYMFIGGSPVGTAGGIKTVTLGVIFVAFISALRGKDRMEVFNRTMPMVQLQKALAVTFILMAVVFLSFLGLNFTEAGSDFQHTVLDLLFEIASASGTVGLSTGITPFLSSPGKLIVIACMFLGRLGPITVVFALNMRLRNDDGRIGYPEEKVIVG